MLTISNLTYRIAGRTILEDCNVSIMDNWKVGIVGANGAGKSTLFNLIAGDLGADAGDIMLSTKQTFGRVKQDIPDDDTQLIDIVLAADEERTRLLKESETEQDPYKIGEIFTRLNDIDAYAAPARASAILAGLGFSEAQLTMPISDFSGGWRMRVALAAALFQQPEFLLLDEPTNHLDLEAIMWLETYLASYPHTFLVISHDRELLNKCVDHIVHIDNKQLTAYTGNYDTFERERAEKRIHQQALHEKQQKQREHMQAYVDRFRYKASKAKQAQSRIKALEKMDVVDAVLADRSKHFNFGKPEELSPPILSIDYANVGYEEGKPILTNIHEGVDMDDRIALLGANGNGKSTLMKLIAGRLGAMSGDVRRSPKLRIGYFSQHQAEEMDVNSTAYYELQRIMKGEAESVVRGVLGQYGFNKALADNRIGDLSGGEKARLLFAFMTVNKPHMLLLDEPTNHLDIEAREALVRALNVYEGAVVIVSHDPSMVERVADRLWLVENGSVHDFDGDLEAYRKHVIDSRRLARKGEKEAAASAAGEPTESDEDKEKRKLESKKRKKFSKLYKQIGVTERKFNKLTEKKQKFETLMGEDSFYDDQANAQKVQSDYTELAKELETAENAWLAAQEAYEQAEV